MNNSFADNNNSISSSFIMKSINRKKSMSMINLRHTIDISELKKDSSLASFNEKCDNLSTISSCTSLKQNKILEEIIQQKCQTQKVEINAYKKRWFLLIILVLNLTISFAQWLQFCIISNSIEKIFNIDSDKVSFTSLIFMIFYCLLFIPVAFYCENHSFNHVAIIGSFGTSCAAWIKIFSIKYQNFNYVFLGQAACAIFQIFLSNLPSKLAENWFKRNESSLISGLSIFANQLGMAVSFLLTPLIVEDSDNVNELKKSLQVLLMLNAGTCTILTVIIIAMFESNPNIPPNHWTALKKLQCITDHEKNNIFQSIKSLVLNKNFSILIIGYGLNIGIFNSFSTLLNSIVTHYFPNSQGDVGKVGLSLILVGLLGSVVFAFVLENFHEYKMTAIWNIRMQSIAIILFFLALESRSKILLSIASILLGFFMTGFQLIGYEYGIELTFPESESYVGGILNVSGYFFGVILTLLIQKLHTAFTILFGNLFFALLLMVGIMILSLTNQSLRRYNANLFIEQTVTECENMDGSSKSSDLTKQKDKQFYIESGIESESDDNEYLSIKIEKHSVIT